MTTRGKIEVITGPMMSGKTGETLRRLRRIEFAGRRFLMLKPNIDIRYGQGMVTDRDKNIEVDAEMLPTSLRENVLKTVYEMAKDYDAIGIDEVQFFDKSIIELCQTLRNQGKRVIICGLDTDYKNEPFGYIGSLMAIANDVQKLQAVCVKCKDNDAYFTQRLLNGEPAPEGELVAIGDKDKTEHSKFTYDARCLNCYVHPSKVKITEEI